jgi:hypothetical protein
LKYEHKRERGGGRERGERERGSVCEREGERVCERESEREIIRSHLFFRQQDNSKD